MFLDIVGYFFGLMLAFCVFPQFIKTIKDGHCRGLSRTFLWMWFVGLAGMLAHTYILNSLTGALALNFVVNLLFSGVSLIYSYFPKNRSL